MNHFERIKERKTESDQKNEQALNATSCNHGQGHKSKKHFSKQFKGNCRGCGKYGCKIQYCPSESGNESADKKSSDSGIYSSRNVKCYHCGGWGHKKPDCKKLSEEKKRESKNDKSQSAVEREVEFVAMDATDPSSLNFKGKSVRFNEQGMHCFINVVHYESFTKNIWIGDIGASCHLTNSLEGMFDMVDIQEEIEGSSGSISDSI